MAIMTAAQIEKIHQARRKEAAAWELNHLARKIWDVRDEVTDSKAAHGKPEYYRALELMSQAAVLLERMEGNA